MPTKPRKATTASPTHPKQSSRRASAVQVRNISASERIAYELTVQPTDATASRGLLPKTDEAISGMFDKLHRHISRRAVGTTLVSLAEKPGNRREVIVTINAPVGLGPTGATAAVQSAVNAVTRRPQRVQLKRSASK